MDLDQIPQTHKHTASLQGVYIAYPLCSSSVVVVYKFYGGRICRHRDNSTRTLTNDIIPSGKLKT